MIKYTTVIILNGYFLLALNTCVHHFIKCEARYLRLQLSSVPAREDLKINLQIVDRFRTSVYDSTLLLKSNVLGRKLQI